MPSTDHRRSPAARRTRRRSIPSDTRQLVLFEAGYKCANPVCRNILTLQVHHIVWVRDGGTNDPSNLVPLCGHCHDLHTQGHVPAAAIRVWKALLVSLNTPQRNSVDILLHLHRFESEPFAQYAVYSAGDLLSIAPLLNAGLVEATCSQAASGVSGPPWAAFNVALTERGRLLVDAWKHGDEDALAALITGPAQGGAA